MGRPSQKVAAILNSLVRSFQAAEGRWVESCRKAPGSHACKSGLERVRAGLADLRNAGMIGELKITRISVQSRLEKRMITGKFGPRFSRGESVQLIDVEGYQNNQGSDWWLVRSGNGVNAWLHKAELLPELPPERSTQAGTAGGITARDEVEIGGRG